MPGERPQARREERHGGWPPIIGAPPIEDQVSDAMKIAGLLDSLIVEHHRRDYLASLWDSDCGKRRVEAPPRIQIYGRIAHASSIVDTFGKAHAHHWAMWL